MDSHNKKNCKVYNIESESELRFLINETPVSLMLLDGYAEIFGTELIKGEMYTFLPPASIALFTWQGCSVKFYGKTKKVFVENDSPMIIPAYIHACLEEMRLKAEAENTRGPISLVVGAKDVGKSSFCRILLNYAARQGRRPLYIDLNVDQNSATLPGAMSILPVEKPCDVTEGFNHRALSVYSFGYVTPSSNIPLYLLIVREISKNIQSRLDNANRNTRFSGVIVDTYGWVNGEGYNLNKTVASAFKADIIFVIHDRKLYFHLKRDIPTLEVVFVPKSFGTYARHKIFRSRCRDHCIWDYFYGLKNRLNPCKFEVKFNDIEIYKISPVSRFRIQRDISFKNVNVIKVPIGEDLLYYVLSLSYSNVADESIITANILGFICITSVCLANKVVTILSPQPYPLPSRILIIGDVKLK